VGWKQATAKCNQRHSWPARWRIQESVEHGMQVSRRVVEPERCPKCKRAWNSCETAKN